MKNINPTLSTVVNRVYYLVVQGMNKEINQHEKLYTMFCHKKDTHENCGCLSLYPRGGIFMINKKLMYLAYIAVVVVLIVLVVGHKLHKDKQQAQIVTTNTLQDSQTLSKDINVTPATAVQIHREIQHVKEPVVSYYVQAPDVATATKQTQQAIHSNSTALPAIVTAKSDRTIVTPNEQQQKVDVYKINLNKAHKIKAGITVIDDKSYATLGYQAGKFEGLVHLKGEGKVKGATALYTVMQW